MEVRFLKTYPFLASISATATTVCISTLHTVSSEDKSSLLLFCAQSLEDFVERLDLPEPARLHVLQVLQKENVTLQQVRTLLAR